MKNKKTLIIILTEVLVSIVIFASVVLFCLNFFKVGSGFGKELIPSGKKDAQTSASSDYTDEEIVERLNKMATTVVGSVSVTGEPTTDSSAKDLTFVISTENPGAAVQVYTDYLESLSAENVKYLSKAEDLDADGTNEYLIEIQNSLADFCNAVGDSKGAEHIQKIYDESDAASVVLLYGSYADGKLVFRGFNEAFSAEGADVSLEDGNLIFTFEGAESRKFVGYPDNVYANYDDKAEAFNALCNSFCKYETGEGYDVRFCAAEVADVEGTPVVVSSSNEGGAYSRVYSVTDGTLHLICSNPFEECATYIVEIDSSEYLLTYTQSLNAEADDYTATYRYRVFRIDENYSVKTYDEMITTVKAESYTEENGTFFEKLNTYLKDAVLCSDPYALNGNILNPYSVGPDGEIDTSSSYLAVKNCNTSNQGTVKVSEGSYLNFRSGPSVNDKRVRIDSSDSAYYVKQNKGTTVTVVDVINKGSAENPVWLKVNVKYPGRTLEGYCSKKYIELSDVKKIAVGEEYSFEVVSDSGVKWSSGDEKIAKINPDTGKIKGIKEGLVMISVTSDSGLSESFVVSVEKE